MPVTIIKRKILAFAFIVVPVIMQAQISETHYPDRTRNIIWHTPCGASQINGLAVGIQAARFGNGTLTIKGVNADVGLGSAYATLFILGAGTLPKAQRQKIAPVHRDSANTIIYGLSMSYGGEIEVEIHGVSIAGGMMLGTKLYGISLTGIYSKTYEFRGVCIGGLINYSVEGKGLQIGLFNHCKQLKGIQIGLWNKSGKRSLPFVNWGT